MSGGATGVVVESGWGSPVELGSIEGPRTPYSPESTEDGMMLSGEQGGVGSMAEKTFHRYVDLDDALEDKKIPLENRPIIRAFVATIGCAKFESTTSYIKATRRQPGPDLNIAYGWTTGFATREEAQAAGGTDVWPWGRRWGITHPVHMLREGGGARRAPLTSERFCPRCNMELPLAGGCPDCEE